MPLQRLVIAVLSSLLTLSFFMTWIQIDLGFFVRKVSGSALPGQIRSILAAGDAMSVAFGGSSSGAGAASIIFYLLYFIPITAAFLAFRAITDRPGRQPLRVQAMITGGVGAILAGVMGLLLGNLIGSDLSAILVGNGYGLTLLTSVGLLLTPLLVKADAKLKFTPEQQRQAREQGQLALTQAGGWLTDRQQQAKSHIENTRLKHALGRKTNRDLLTAADELLAPQGTVITHQLISQARQAGVIDLLLASVDRDNTVDHA